MNVEEGMKLLRDPKVWDVELQPRAGVFAQARPRVLQLVGVGLAASVVVALIASAVVFGTLKATPHPAGPDVTSSPIPTEPAPSPIPTATEIPPTGLSAPAAIFGGDCTRFASDERMKEIVGGTATPVVYPDNDEDNIEDDEPTSYRQLGIITCLWKVESGNVRLTLLRDDVAPGTHDATCDSYAWGEASLNDDLCVVDVVSDGIRVSGDISWPSRSESRAIAKRLVSYIEGTDLSAAAGPAPVAGVGAWKSQIKCADLSPVDVEGTPVDLILDIPGTDAGSLPVEDQIRDLYSTTGCYGNFKGEDGKKAFFGFTAVSDGAWQLDEALDALDYDSADYEAIDIAGFDTAVRSADENARNYYLVDGTNYLQVRVSGEVDDKGVIATLLAKLEASN